MTDYGHDLLFGSFITPVAHPADHGITLASASERAGLDLVTFQDHPYQPQFHDTSTLLTQVAARTERITVSANVASLPLRPPLTLARASATLDRLSGGRFALGLGAGAFWDGIAHMSGRRLTPGQAADALGEGIGLIREAWDTDAPGTITRSGRHYSVEGARRGPRPAHDIPIWVGSYKPRMLALTGRLADGWLPSIEYIEGGMAGIAAANARIDDAADAAGRGPHAVRRLLNFMRVDITSGRGPHGGSPSAFAEQIATLALDHGFSAFIVAGDDPATIERFGAEVVPAAREAIARARG